METYICCNCKKEISREDIEKQLFFFDVAEEEFCCWKCGNTNKEEEM